MKKFTFILCFITFYSFSQGVELPKINKVEELMKAEKFVATSKTTAVSDTSDYGINFDTFNPKVQTKPRFDNFTSSTPDEIYETLSDGTKVVKFENYIPGTDNNERLAQEKLAVTSERERIDKTQINPNYYNGFLYAFVVIIFFIFLIKRIYK